MGDPKQHPPSVTLSPGNLGSIHQRLARQTGSIKLYMQQILLGIKLVSKFTIWKKISSRILKIVICCLKDRLHDLLDWLNWTQAQMLKVTIFCFWITIRYLSVIAFRSPATNKATTQVLGHTLLYLDLPGGTLKDQLTSAICMRFITKPQMTDMRQRQRRH